MTPHENRIVIFAKAPVAGLVKTRLCPPLTYEQAAALYRTMARETFAVARSCSNVRVEIAYEARPGYTDANWMDGRSAVPGGLTVPGAPRMAAEGAVPFFPQGEGDLGTRLTRGFQQAFKTGATKVVAIGCDCPHMDPRRFDEAFDALDRCDVALGPAADGGYYLIGLKREQPSLFNAIPWSMSEVFTATMARIREADLSVGVLAVEHDIDQPADLEEVRNLDEITEGFPFPSFLRKQESRLDARLRGHDKKVENASRILSQRLSGRSPEGDPT